MPIEEVSEIFEKLKKVLQETAEKRVDQAFFNKYIIKKDVKNSEEELEDLKIVSSIMKKNKLDEKMIDKIAKLINIVKLSGNMENSLDILLRENSVEVKDGMVILPQEEEFTPDNEEKEEESKELKLSPKAKKLEAKIEELVQKVGKERNLFKRHMLSYRIKKLIARFDREIELIKIKNKYIDARRKLREERNKRDYENEGSIGELTVKIEDIQKTLDENKIYDSASPKFAYPKDYVENNGGTEKLKQQLKNREDGKGAKFVDKMEQVDKVRQELEKAQKELLERQKELDNSNKIYKESSKKLNREEESLTKVHNADTLIMRVKNFFKYFVNEIASYFKEKKESKQSKNEQEEKQQKLEENRNNAEQELTERYKRQEQEILEQDEEKKQYIVTKYNVQEQMMQSRQKEEIEEITNKYDTQEQEMLKQEKEEVDAVIGKYLSQIRKLEEQMAADIEIRRGQSTETLEQLKEKRESEMQQFQERANKEQEELKMQKEMEIKRHEKESNISEKKEELRKQELEEKEKQRLKYLKEQNELDDQIKNGSKYKAEETAKNFRRQMANIKGFTINEEHSQNKNQSDVPETTTPSNSGQSNGR